MGLLGRIFSKKTAQEEIDARAKFPSAEPDQGATSSYAVVEVQDVYSIMGVGVVPVGKVVEGTLYPGFKARLGNKVAVVKSIEANHMQLRSAQVGENIGFNLSGVQKVDIQRGMRLRFESP